MIYKNDCTLPKEYLEQLTEEGLESLPEMIRLLVNQAMRIDHENLLRRNPDKGGKPRKDFLTVTNPKH